MKEKRLFKSKIFRDMVKIAVSEDKIYEKKYKKRKITEKEIKKIVLAYLNELDNKE